MPITLEKLNKLWESRNFEDAPLELLSIVCNSKAFRSLRQPTSAYDAALLLVVAYACGLHFGYTIAQNEKLEELCNERSRS